MAKRKIRKLKKGVCYFIEWRDAYSGPNSWQSQDEIEDMFHDEYLVWTLGWLQKETEHYYIFASSVTRKASHDSKGSVWAIPKGMVATLREVTFDD